MKWTPLNLPKPEDGKRYDIRLKDGRIIKGVEFWDFGGGFAPLEIGATSDNASSNVKFPISIVKEYRAVEP